MLGKIRTLTIIPSFVPFDGNVCSIELVLRFHCELDETFVTDKVSGSNGRGSSNGSGGSGGSGSGGSGGGMKYSGCGGCVVIGRGGNEDEVVSHSTTSISSVSILFCNP